MRHSFLFGKKNASSDKKMNPVYWDSGRSPSWGEIWEKKNRISRRAKKFGSYCPAAEFLNVSALDGVY